MCVCVSVCVFSHSVMSNSLWPHGLQPTRFLYPWDFPGKNIGVGCHFLLQGNFSTQGSNLYLLCLLYCRQIFYHWATGSQQSGKFIKRWEYQTTLSASWEICTQVKKQQLKPDMEQQTGSKLGKEYIKAVYCHPAYFTYMLSTSCEMPGCMIHKLESRLLGDLSTISDMQMIIL